MMVNEPVSIPGLAKQVVSREGHWQGWSRRKKYVDEQNKDWIVMICMYPRSNKGRMWNAINHGFRNKSVPRTESLHVDPWLICVSLGHTSLEALGLQSGACRSVLLMQ